METVYFNKEGGGGPEPVRTSTTTEMLKMYYTKRTRMRIDQEQKKGHGNRQEYPAPDKEMRHETSELMPKPATANRNSLLFPRTNKNDSYPFHSNYGGGGGLEHIRVGYLYELNHSLRLPDKNSIPSQLKSVRVVMVILRTEVNVTLRFPSVESLHAHYSNTHAIVSDDRNKWIQYQHPQRMKKGKSRVHPELDEEYVMNVKLAGKILIRKILSSEFSKQKHLKSFWVLTSQQPKLASTPVQDHSGSDDYCVSDDDDDDGNCNEAQVGRIGLNRGTENYQSNLCRSWSSGGSSRYDNKLVMRKRGTCWSALTKNSDLHWGVRRRVAFMGPNKSNSNNDHQQDYRAEVSNRFMRKSSGASEHQYYQHHSSLGIFEAVPEEEDEEQGQDEEGNANEVVEIMGMDQNQNIFRTNTTEDGDDDDDDDEEYDLSPERRRSLRSRNVDRSSKQLAVLLRNRKRVNNSKTPKKKIKPQSRSGLYNPKKEEEEDSDDEQNKLTCRATRSSSAASGFKIKIKKNNTTKKKKKRRIKNTEQSNKDSQIVIRNKRQLVPVNSYHRWSKERYRKAEVSMFQIMKEKDAVSGKPVMRRVLRMEARKYIGDTGLLDHLLKHMSGKVAPDGEVRFQRRHNAEGEMEYWLEDADLVNIRREAGVKDPYWTPPPEWMPGDNPSQDPLCVKGIKFSNQLSETRVGLSGGTYVMGISHPDGGIALGDTRSTTKYMVPVNMFEEIMMRRTKMDNKDKTKERQSVKIHPVKNFLVAASGTRKFNLEAKGRFGRYLENVETETTSYEAARSFKRIITELQNEWREGKGREEVKRQIKLDLKAGKDVRKHEKLLETIEWKSKKDIDSSFIIITLEAGVPQIHQISNTEEDVKPVTAFAFSGSITQDSHTYLTNLLNTHLTDQISFLNAAKLAQYCLTHVTGVAEDNKSGVASVGGWGRMWTIQKKDKRIPLPYKVMKEIEMDEDIIAVCYDLGKIPIRS